MNISIIHEVFFYKKYDLTQQIFNKMKKSFIIILFSAFFTQALFAQVNVTLFMDQKLGDQAFAYNVAVESEMGYVFNVTRLEYYVSEIMLIHDGGQVTPVTDRYLLVDPDKRNEFELGSFQINDLEKIQFSVGVDSAHNHLDPAGYPVEHPLAPKDPSMHWGWFSGYRFIALEGRTGDHPDSLAYGYQIHTIADANYRTITLDVVEEISGSDMTVHIEADYMQMLKDIDLTGGLIFHGANGAAKKLSDNSRDFVFTAAEVTAVKDIEKLASIQFSPNPSTGITVLSYDLQQFENLVLTVTDMKGSSVFTGVIDNAQKSYLLDTKWQPGLYMANIFSGNKLLAAEKLLVK